MITEHLSVEAFSMLSLLLSFIIIILISNTCLAFAVVIHTPQYNAGYSAACSDVKHGIEIWDQEGSIWDGFYQKYPSSLTNNMQWMQGYRDGAICTHIHTPQYNAGFSIGCHDKIAGMMHRDAEGNTIAPPGHENNMDWIQGYWDSGAETSFCHAPINQLR